MRIGLAVLFLVAGPAGAEVTVHVTDGKVDVHATAAPLAEVLDRLARQTGMKVVYEGATPRPLVSLSLERRTPAQAVLGILEGLGLNYALQLDATGTRVQTLVMAGAATSSASRSSIPAPVQRNLPPLSSPDQVEEEELPDEPEESEPVPPPGTVPPPGPVPLPGPGVTPGSNSPFPGMTSPSYPSGLAPNPFARVPGVPTPPGPTPQTSPSPSEPR